MTVIFTEATIQTILDATFNSLSSTYGLPMIVLLLAVLTGKELARCLTGQQSKTILSTFDIASVPLFLALGCVLVMRLLYLLGAL